MLGALYFLEPPPPSSPRLDGQDILVLVLMPLLSWYMLLEGVTMAGVHPWHAAWVFGSYAPTFAVTLYFVLRRGRLNEPGKCSKCGYDLRATPGRCPECGTAATTPA
jgi:hypothetical protein